LAKAIIETGWSKTILPGQTRLLDAKATIIGYVGGLGAGKTKGGAMKFIDFMASNVGKQRDKLYYGICAISYPLGYRSCYQAITDELDYLTIEYEVRHRPSPGLFIPIFNAVVYFMSGNNPESLVATNLAGVWVDEPFLQKRIVFDKLIGRVRQPQAENYMFLLTGTPEELNWGYDVFKECEPNGAPLMLGEFENEVDVQLITASSRENYHLPRHYVMMLESQYDERMVQAYVDGKFVALQQSAVYYNFASEIHVKIQEYSPSWTTFLAFDFNVDPMSIIVGQYINRRYKKPFTRILTEVSMRGSNTREATYRAEAVLKDFGHFSRRDYLEIYGDATHGRSTVSSVPDETDWDIIRTIFPDASYCVPNSNPPVKRRHNVVNGILLNALGENWIVFDPSAKELIRDFEQCKYKPGTTTEDKSDPKRTHKADALGYYLVEKIMGQQSMTYGGKIL